MPRDAVIGDLQVILGLALSSVVLGLNNWVLGTGWHNSRSFFDSSSHAQSSSHPINTCLKHGCLSHQIGAPQGQGQLLISSCGPQHPARWGRDIRKCLIINICGVAQIMSVHRHYPGIISFPKSHDNSLKHGRDHHPFYSQVNRGAER